MADAEAIKELRGITDPVEYFRALGKYKEKYLICVAVKDNVDGMAPELTKIVQEFGLTDIRPNGWCSYAYVSDCGNVLLNKAGIDHKPLIEQVVTSGIHLQVISKSWRAGKALSIRLDGHELAVQLRGFNIVVFDVSARILLDSVCFDVCTVDGRPYPCTRLSDFPDIPFPPMEPEDQEGTADNLFDIDEEFDKIIEKYRLDEYYPHYTYRRKAGCAIRELASTWGENESIACVTIGKNRTKAHHDELHFLEHLTEEQKTKVDFLYFQLQTSLGTDSYNLDLNCRAGDYREFENIKWDTFTRVYIISNHGDNYIGYWFRKRHIEYVNLYDYLAIYGVCNVGIDMEYYDFIVDKRDDHFVEMDREMGPLYWEIYEEQARYEMYKSAKYRLTIAKKLFFLALVLKDFFFAETWMKKILENGGDSDHYQRIWNEIQDLLNSIRTKLKERNQKDIVALWVDQVEYDLANDNMPFLSSLKEKGVWFENCFTFTGYTRESLRTIFTGKKLIDDHTNDIHRIGFFNSPLFQELMSYKYRILIHGGYFKKVIPDFGKKFYLDYEEGSAMLWGTICRILKSSSPCFIMNHIVSEPHEPSLGVAIKDEHLSNWFQRKLLGCRDMDRQIQFYLEMLGQETTSIIFGDHGYRVFWPRQHVVFAVYGKKCQSRKISGLFSLRDFSLVVRQILENQDIDESDLCHDVVEFQGVTILRGGKYVSPAGTIREATPRYGPPFRGYRGIVTNKYVYIHFGGGREWLSRRDPRQPALSWYERPDDIFDADLLPKMRELAGIDYGHEPPDYGPRSEFYLSLQGQIEKNFPYNQRKIFLANQLIARLPDASAALHIGNPAAGEFYLMLSLENRKKILGVLGGNPKCARADLSFPVFSLDEAAQRGVRNIIVMTRTEEEGLKKSISESNHPFHVYGLYGWFALCGYHTKYNFWDFVIESMDEKPASELSIPYFLHHASPKAASVAAVIVTQNDEACIAPCLHRFLGEVTMGVEIYCVDLSSTDKTVEIIQGYGKIDSSIHVTVVKQEELWGKLTELLASMGEKYVAFFSPRDILHPRAVSYLHGAAEAAGADVVASCAVLPSSEEGKALEKNIREGELALKLEADFVSMVYPARYEEALSQAPSLFHGARLYRTGFLRENKIRLSDEGDGMFFLKVMFQTAKYVRTAEPVCVSESARHGGMQERFRECYERNRKAVNGYRLWHHALPLLPEYGEQPVMPIPLGSGRYAYLNRNEKKISQVFEIRRTDKVEKSFFRDLSRPIIVVGEMNLRHWEHLYQNLAKSEDFGADNHVYLCYNTLDEFLLLLQVEDISPYLAEEKFVFLFGQRDVAENYPLDFENIYHETYRQEGNVPILRRILPGDHWQGLADKEFQAWLDKSARGILASREFEMSDLSRLYAIYEDVAVGK